MSFAYTVNRSEPLALLLGVTAITVAWILPYPGSPQRVAYSVLIIASAVILHELGHRQVARSRGCYSRFVLDPMGLTVTLVSALLPVKFLAPGYVGISCPFYAVSRDTELRISAAGPLANLLLALAALVTRISYPSPTLTEMLALNAWLALFNLLPIGPLDGAKVLRASRTAWITMFAWAAIMLYAA
jgi:Zn-dependent protease